MSLPLEGITVLDFSRFLPAASGTMMLGDMGANIIRIETPLPEEKHLSKLMVSVKEESEEKRLAYDCRFRNKKSITINLKDKRSKDIFVKLLEKTDIIVSDFLASVAKKLGVDYETVKRIKPDIIYCAVSGYGQTGPYHDFPGFDPNFIALGGLLGITGDSNGNHVLPGIPVGDMSAGLFSTIGVLLALRVKEQTGKGQLIDFAVTDGVAYLVGVRHGPFFFSEGAPIKRGSRLTHTYRTKDNKFLCFAFGTPVYWEAVCRAVGMEQYIPYWKDIQALGLEDAMSDPQGVRHRQKEAVNYLANILLTRDRDEWFALLSRSGAAVTPVYEMDEVFSDPQLVHRQMLQEVEHPRLGKVKQVGIPIKLSETPGAIRKLSPLRGENTEEILKSLGYTDTEIKTLRESKVV
jgi:crotonobetainyl-CoA:carnitine CoA-transferase CaiB-like acyl-CoA transferase